MNASTWKMIVYNEDEVTLAGTKADELLYTEVSSSLYSCWDIQWLLSLSLCYRAQTTFTHPKSHPALPVQEAARLQFTKTPKKQVCRLRWAALELAPAGLHSGLSKDNTELEAAANVSWVGIFRIARMLDGYSYWDYWSWHCSRVMLCGISELNNLERMIEGGFFRM